MLCLGSTLRRRTRTLAGLALVAWLLAGCAADVAAPEGPVRDDDSVPLIGAYVPSGVWNDLVGLREFERELGGRVDVGHWFTNWDYAYDPVPVRDLHLDGRVPLVSWQPMRQSIADIAAGLHDDYVRSWARGVATADDLVYIRLFPEMNGDWVPWNGDPSAFRAAWRHVAALFAAEGADNVRWVFSPNVTDEPRTDANRMEHYYPGPDVVDVFGLSGYNWGTVRPHIGWRSFEQVFRSGYDRLAAIGEQPIWLTEIASSERGGSKAAWIRAMFRAVGSAEFARIDAIVWFNEEKEADWRVESSPASLAAFRSWFE
jgi:mannan endo-1,4-beta-mannosidase